MSLWVLAVDGMAATAWRGNGSDDGSENEDDFNRALDVSDGAIKVGKTKGMVLQLGGTTGWSHVWKIDGGIALLDIWVQSDDKDAVKRGLALRVAQWPSHKARKLGTLEITSGTIGVMLPYRGGAFTPKEVASAKGGKVVKTTDGDRLLLPLTNGTYDVVRSVFGPTAKTGHEDELATYTEITKIVRR